MAYMEEEKKRINKGGSTITDPSRFLNQNQDAAKRTASGIGNQVASATSQAGQGIRSATNIFNEKARSGIPQFDKNLVNRAATDPRSFYNYQQASTQPEQKPYWLDQNNPNKKAKGPNKMDMSQYVPFLSAGANPGKKANTPNPQQPIEPQAPQAIDPLVNEQFRNMLTSQYAGPNSLQDATDLNPIFTDIAKAKTLAEQAGSEPGLANLAGSGNLGALDAMLMNAAGGSQIISDASQGANQLGEQLNDAGLASMNTAKTAKKTSAKELQDIMAQLAGAKQSFAGQSDAFKTQSESQRKELYDQLNPGQRKKMEKKMGGYENFNPIKGTNQYEEQLAALNDLLGNNF